MARNSNTVKSPGTGRKKRPKNQSKGKNSARVNSPGTGRKKKK